eukprot:TRINITY_DN10875_c0_g1_i3.p2 TRINITY_DN10875_c0_g1~~TRINITY_DN10875_c0_g1_i3.p2  ORF type:complete len:146 (-),score=18.32 TRINITY_DN10875_c0_g1_i3:298-735(-)
MTLEDTVDYVVELITSYIDVDFLLRYIIILSNFVIIIALAIKKRRQGADAADEGELKKPNIVLFVTAHPDDETMFFIPAIRELKQEYKLHLLCLSNGKLSKLSTQMIQPSLQETLRDLARQERRNSRRHLIILASLRSRSSIMKS